MTIKTAPEWVHETFGAAALELGLYDDADPQAASGREPEADDQPDPGARPAWLLME